MAHFVLTLQSNCHWQEAITQVGVTAVILLPGACCGSECANPTYFGPKTHAFKTSWALSARPRQSDEAKVNTPVQVILAPELPL